MKNTLLLALVLTSLPAAAQSSALALGWKGYADTDLKFTEFYNYSFTFTARIMMQYPRAYEGPIVAESDPGATGAARFVIGQGDYLAAPVGPKINIAFGYEDRVFPVTANPGEWHHIAVSVDNEAGRLATVYFDGVSVGSFEVSLANVDMPPGTVRFGKRAPGLTFHSRDAQFYGLIDDAAFYNYAMRRSDVVAAMGAALTGSEAGLVAAYTFDSNASHFKLKRPVTVNTSARVVRVSADRNNAADLRAIPVFAQATEMTLPFKPGEAWKVVQAFGGTASHFGYAAFCWDFVLDGYPQANAYPSGTANAPFYAAAPGKVTYVLESSGSGSANTSNAIVVEQAPGEIAAYLHAAKNSINPVVNDHVHRYQDLGDMGDTGVGAGAHHLHFAVSDRGDSSNAFITYPVAFTNYEVKQPNGTWKRVSKGMPAVGEVVRIPPPSTERFTAVWRPAANPVEELAMQSVSNADFAGVFNPLLDLGWRVASLETYVENNQAYRNFVLRRTRASEDRQWGVTFNTFKTRYDELFPKGWRVSLFQAYEINGQVLYDVVYVPGSGDERRTFGSTFQTFKTIYDILWGQGWRIAMVQTYVSGGQVLYNAIWRQTNTGEIGLYGVTYQTYRAKYDEIWPQGWRLRSIQTYTVNGKVFYNAVWIPNTTSEFQMYSSSFEAILKKEDEMKAAGWRMEFFDSLR